MKFKFDQLNKLFGTRLVIAVKSIFHMIDKLTWRAAKTFSAMYLCKSVAPLCCSLSGCRHKIDFWYAFFTCELSISFIRGIAIQPLLGHRIWRIEHDYVNDRLINKIIISNCKLISPVIKTKKTQRVLRLTWCREDNSNRMSDSLPINHNLIFSSSMFVSSSICHDFTKEIN